MPAHFLAAGVVDVADDADFPALGRALACQHLDQLALAVAGNAGDADDLAATHRERYVVNGHRAGIVKRVDLAEREPDITDFADPRRLKRQFFRADHHPRHAVGREIGDLYHASREEMRRHKMSLLPEEPLKNACVGGMSVADNIAFREFDRAPFASGGWWLNRAAFRTDAEKKIGLYKIKTRTPDTPISALSGGNVQRAVLARELGAEVEVLSAANPCFGLDFAAVAQIHAEIMAARNRGAAVLLVSEDLDELLELSDRLLVMFHGQLVYEARASEADLTEIGRHMAGH